MVKNTITARQVVQWTTYAQQRRIEEGIDGPWWELIPPDQQELAKQWAEKNKIVFNRFFGGVQNG